MKILLFPKFSNVFPEAKMPTIDSLLPGISSKIIIEILCFLNAQLHLKSQDYNFQKGIVSKFIERLDNSSQNEFARRINKFLISNQSKNLVFFSPIIILQFIQDELICNRKGKENHLTPIEDFNILIAILIYNERNDTSKTNATDLYLGADDQFRKLVWPATLPQIEYSFKRNVILYAYKSILLFEFLEKDLKYSQFIQEYYAKTGTHNYKDFLTHWLALYMNGYRKDTSTFSHRFSNDVLEKNPILNILKLDMNSFNSKQYLESKKEKDFRGLREFPLLSYYEYFLITEWNFVIEKTHLGLIFDLFQKTTLSNEMSFPDFKTEISYIYSEKRLFIHIMDEIFSSDRYKSLNESSQKEFNLDYYVIDNSSVLLFEFKDEIIPKVSDYKKIKSIIEEKFVESISKGKRQKKGISQISSMINKLIENPSIIEELDKSTCYKVYPILVYTDKGLSLPGMNRYLNKKFLPQLNSLKNNNFEIAGLTLIDIDFFLDYFDFLKNNRYNFVEMLDKYSGIVVEKELRMKWMQDPEGPYIINSCFEEIISQQYPRIENITEGALFKEIIKRLEIK